MVDGWPKPASSAVRTLWVAATLARSVFCVSVMARWRVCGIVKVDKRFWDRGFAVSTVNCLLDFQAVKSEFQAASDGVRDLCCSSAFADARRSADLRLLLTTLLPLAMRCNWISASGNRQRLFATLSRPSM